MLLFVLTAYWFVPPVPFLSAMIVPLIVDGTVQARTTYESNNVLRLITGMLCGYAVFGLFGALLLSGYTLGYQFGKEHIAR